MAVFWLVLPMSLVAAVVAAHHVGFVAWHRAHGRVAPAGLEWVRHEVVDSAWLALWYVRGFFSDGPRPGKGRPVLMVHGYSQSGANFLGLRAHLSRPSVAVSLLHRLAPIRWYAARLETHLDRLVRRSPDGIDVVTHSMGAVVLRQVLSTRRDLAGCIRTVVTLGAPHGGTAAVRWIPLLPEVVALQRGSALLARLPSLVELVPGARVVTIAALADTVVYPIETALVEGAQHVVLAGMGHAGLLTRRASFEAVAHALGSSEAEFEQRAELPS